MMETMKAARVTAFGPPSLIQVEDIAVPAPGPDDVLVAVHAASVTPLDTYLRAGVSVGAYTPTPPYTPGASLAGIVAEAGAHVRRLNPGDRVYGRAVSGANAQYAVCPERMLFPLPERVDFADGALIAVPYETAFHSLVDLAQAAGGETVLVQGAAGSVGAASVQLARMLGLRVIATCAGRDRAAVTAHGAHLVLDYKLDDVVGGVRAFTDGAGVDIVVEIAARTNLSADLQLAAAGGRIVIVGGTGDTPFNALPVIAKGLRIFGVDLRSVSPRRNTQVNAAIGVGLENGWLRPSAAHQFPLDRAADAHAAIEAGGASGGLVLTMRDG